MSFRELLVETHGYMPPAHILEGLSGESAERHAAPAMHSIAEIVAHMTFWQDWFITRARGEAAPLAAPASRGWPAVTPGSWSTWHDRFLRGLDEAVTLGADTSRLDQPVTPPIDFPPLAHLTHRDLLIHIATHNAHHLGQVITLRQMMGLWPPPAGSWTW